MTVSRQNEDVFVERTRNDANAPAGLEVECRPSLKARREPRPPGTRIKSLLLCFWSVILISVGAVRSEDRVTLQRSGSTGTMTVAGEIEDVTARRLTIRLQDGEVRRSFPTEEVVSIETHRSEPHRQALEAMATGQYRDAEPLLRAAIDKDVRRWVQQDLYADLVRCALRRGDRQMAGEDFARMITQEPSSRHWDVAPLIWSAEEIGADLRTAASDWLGSPETGARLVGASILLLDLQQSDAARRALDELSRSPEESLQALAQAQLWRLRLAAGDVSATELQTWRQQVEAMPASIRSGPMYIIGRVSAARSDLEQAAADWLWLPLVYDDDQVLAARACVDAADALSRLGRSEEAVGLYQETIGRFGWSPAAGDAQLRLKSLSNEGDADGE